MMRNWKWPGLELVFIAALTAPVCAGQSDGPPAEGNRDAVILKQLEALKNSIDGLTKSIEKLNSANVAAGLQINKAQGDIEGLKGQIAQLQRDLDELRRTATPPRVANYPPQPPPAGRVRIVNSYLVPETVIVNGRAYNVDPGTVRTETIPAGVFSYEVVGVQGLRDRQLVANETFTITIHP